MSHRGRHTRLARWAGDLRLGVRLAIGGGRTSKTGVARLVLGTIGIGIAVAVLLVGASAGPMFNARSDRARAVQMDPTPVPGVDPLYIRHGVTDFRDRTVIGTYLRVSGPRAPIPPGVERLPADGEIVLSPALAELLAGPDGGLLRPRFPQRIIGTIGQPGVVDADSLTFYAGDDSIDADNAGQPVYAFGTTAPDRMPANLVVLIAIGTVVLLVPVFVFVGTSARIAGAERDRRLAALRLVGADSRQARRVAVAESLVSAVTGLALGIGLFLLFRTVVGKVAVLGVRPYPSDVAPAWPLVVLIVLSVPGLAVLTAQLALRRTIIEPLGVVRRGRPVRRRLWWRLVPLVLGPVLLASQFDVSSMEDTWLPSVIAGSALLLLGIPAILPWLLERAVARVRGGRPAAQLAIRRLQIDSGTPARVVGGVAVVLAGAIALQAVLAGQEEKYGSPVVPQVMDLPAIMVYVEGDETDAVGESLRATPGIQSVIVTRQAGIMTGNREYLPMSIVDCATLLRYTDVGRCVDGDAFRFAGALPELSAGQAVSFVATTRNGYAAVSRWTVPDGIRTLRDTSGLYLTGGLVVTPGAVRGVTIPASGAYLGVRTEPGRPDMIEHVRNAIAAYGWRASVQSYVQSFRPPVVELFLTIRNGLLGGALFTLLLAGVSMLVLALEQVRERRRPLAALAATGVPTGTLARSLLWQNAVPVLLAVLVAVVTGISLAALVFELLGESFRMDWSTVALFSGVASLLVLAVTVLTLPTLRSATRLAALRTE
ncbi:MAG TPA: FtsX-like permease family protein [Actinophytocola sp.]|uniref:FtsX-like permease family protein n=1 Tax=Actinophytocola sp. TaxID=1872138 RepID=UPI002DDD6F9A|nr:FtsX-like permease family protein [Actinophytocola sp.]HEV2783050.1 FtsX-like permease family protein [Actinophytocola sp.]